MAEVEEFLFVGGTNADGAVFSDFEFPHHGGVGFSYSSFRNPQSIMNQLYKKVNCPILNRMR